MINKMIKALVVTVAMLAGPAAINTAHAQELTQAQINAVQASLQNKQAITTVETVKSLLTPEAASIGREIGVAVGETAKALNVAVNDFVDSPAGMVTVGLIFWTVAGDEISRIMVALCVFFGSMMIILIFCRDRVTEIKYGEGHTWYGRRKIEEVSRDIVAPEYPLVATLVAAIVSSIIAFA